MRTKQKGRQGFPAGLIVSAGEQSAYRNCPIDLVGLVVNEGKLLRNKLEDCLVLHVGFLDIDGRVHSEIDLVLVRLCRSGQIATHLPFVALWQVDEKA